MRPSIAVLIGVFVLNFSFCFAESTKIPFLEMEAEKILEEVKDEMKFFFERKKYKSEIEEKDVKKKKKEVELIIEAAIEYPGEADAVASKIIKSDVSDEVKYAVIRVIEDPAIEDNKKIPELVRVAVLEAADSDTSIAGLAVKAVESKVRAKDKGVIGMGESISLNYNRGDFCQFNVELAKINLSFFGCDIPLFLMAGASQELSTDSRKDLAVLDLLYPKGGLFNALIEKRSRLACSSGTNLYFSWHAGLKVINSSDSSKTKDKEIYSFSFFSDLGLFIHGPAVMQGKENKSGVWWAEAKLSMSRSDKDKLNAIIDTPDDESIGRDFLLGVSLSAGIWIKDGINVNIGYNRVLTSKIKPAVDLNRWRIGTDLSYWSKKQQGNQ